MRAMRRLVVAAMLFGAGAPVAFAQIGLDDLPGTWECHGPGQHSVHTPPILFFSALQGGDAGSTSLYVDGFSRAINGTATAAIEGGAIRVNAGSASLTVGQFTGVGRTHRIVVTRPGVGSYRCYRLPARDVAPPAAPRSGPTQLIQANPGMYYPVERSYEPMQVPGID